MDRRGTLLMSPLLALAVTLLWLPIASAQPVAIAPDGDADGEFVAVALTGNATGGSVAVSVFGEANTSIYGRNGRTSCGESVSVAGNSDGCRAVSVFGDAHSWDAGVTVLGNASGKFAAVTGTGHARCTDFWFICAALSGTGRANGTAVVPGISGASVVRPLILCPHWPVPNEACTIRDLLLTDDS